MAWSTLTKDVVQLEPGGQKIEKKSKYLKTDGDSRKMFGDLKYSPYDPLNTGKRPEVAKPHLARDMALARPKMAPHGLSHRGGVKKSKN